ncbi:MAG: hypothetical protein ACK4S2_07085 [Gemmobacter sp.]|uniref:hypothetical protein n=1 Tax=Gemmobacter sp. TaxID=1898957 RepID=UPI00391D8402
MRDYGIAHTILTLIEGVGWTAVAAGAVLAAYALGTAGLRAAIVGPLVLVGGVALAGFLVVAVAQIGRAQVATAENTAEIARLLAVAARRGDAQG